MKIEIRSERLEFRKFIPKDFNDYAKLMMHDDVMHYITGKALSKGEVIQRFNKVIDINGKHDLGVYKVLDQETREFIGLGKLVHFEHREFEIGYIVLPQFWGKKYASEMVQCMLEHAKAFDEIETIMAIIDPENIASVRVLEKFGFKLYKKGTIDDLPAEYYHKLLKR